MTENGNVNEDRPRPERDEKGRFLPGGSGGPGRGKTSKPKIEDMSDEDFWDEVETLIRKDMMLDDALTRQRAMKLKIHKDEYLLKKNVESKVESIMTPTFLEYLNIKQHLALHFGGMEGLRESIEKMLTDCPGCPKFSGKPIQFKFPKNDDEQGAGGERIRSPTVNTL